jgi:wobble nucleotide-excising tRNase
MKVKMKREEHRDAIESETHDIKQHMHQHGPAAEQVNAMRKRYLGHGELELAAKEDGYEIRRRLIMHAV